MKIREEYIRTLKQAGEAGFKLEEIALDAVASKGLLHRPQCPKVPSGTPRLEMTLAELVRTNPDVCEACSVKSLVAGKMRIDRWADKIAAALEVSKVVSSGSCFDLVTLDKLEQALRTSWDSSNFPQLSEWVKPVLAEALDKLEGQERQLQLESLSKELFMRHIEMPWGRDAGSSPQLRRLQESFGRWAQAQAQKAFEGNGWVLAWSPGGLRGLNRLLAQMLQKEYGRGQDFYLMPEIYGLALSANRVSMAYFETRPSEAVLETAMKLYEPVAWFGWDGEARTPYQDLQVAADAAEVI